MQTLPDHSSVMIRLTLLILLLLQWLSLVQGQVRLEETGTRIPDHPYPNSHFLTVDSVRIHYRTWNDSLSHPLGKVLLVHGFSGSTFCYRNNTESLVNAGFYVVAVDLPCFGYSGRYPDLNQSQSNRARLLWRLLEVLDHGDTVPWNLVGHSMGGGTVEAMAIMGSARTRSLTIIDGLVFSRNRNLTGAIGMVARNRDINRVLVSYTENNLLTYNTFRKLLRSAYGRQPDSSEVLGYLHPLQVEGTAEAIWGVWTHARETVRLDADSLALMPVLVVWGGRDRWIHKSTASSFLKDIPGAEMVIIQGAGHIPMETDPEVFNALLVSFLEHHNPAIR
jgi:pimeloyl-ACP methyl ester carboxylesterase